MFYNITILYLSISNLDLVAFKEFLFGIPRAKRPSIRRYFTPPFPISHSQRTVVRFYDIFDVKAAQRPRNERFWRRANDDLWHWSSSLIAKAL